VHLRFHCSHWTTERGKNFRMIRIVACGESQSGWYVVQCFIASMFLIFIKASGYALVAEVGDVDMFVINQLNTSPLWKVRALQFTRGLS